MGTFHALLAAALLLGRAQEPAAAAATEAAPAPRAGVVVPPGRVADLLASLPADVRPRALDSAWPAWTDRSAAGWGGEVAWRRWTELVRAEAASAIPSPERRAELAELARAQRRDGDAWAHLLGCAERPELVAALLPLFSPGVEPALAGADPLPDGVSLAPALPPCDEPRGGLRCLAGKRIECGEFRVAAASCSLWVSVDRDGVEVGLRHLGGGPARVRVTPPLPPGVDPGLYYADWDKLPGHVGPIELELSAEENEHVLWLTFVAPEERWPRPRLDALRLQPPEREITLRSPGGDEPHLARFAEALSELFGVRAALRRAGAPPATPLEPVTLRLEGGERGERKLVETLGFAEAFALSARVR